MTDSLIKINSEAIPISSLPDAKIELRKGETTYRVTVSIDAVFSSSIIAVCTIGSLMNITVEDVTYNGVIDGFGVRPGFSIIQVVNATCVV
jgi:hypothetical protein